VVITNLQTLDTQHKEKTCFGWTWWLLICKHLKQRNTSLLITNH